MMSFWAAMLVVALTWIDHGPDMDRTWTGHGPVVYWLWTMVRRCQGEETCGRPGGTGQAPSATLRGCYAKTRTEQLALINLRKASR